MAEATRFVHQIFIADGFGLPEILPDLFQETTGSVRALYPEAEYRLWDGASLQDFLSANFEPAVRAAFETLKPYAYKADLARYCLLFHLGGLYVDLGNKMLRRLDPPTGTGVASFRDAEFGSPCWTALNNGVLWAKAGRPEMRLAIDMILENCRTRYYGTTWLYPTGPVLLGRALIAVKAAKGRSASSDDQWIGASRPARLNGRVPTLRFVTPDRRAVALRVKTHGADLTHVGAVGTNNYATIWRSRGVYGEVTRRWPFDDMEIMLGDGVRRTGTGIVMGHPGNGASASILYGALEPGRYLFSIEFGRVTSLPRLTQDVVCGGGETIASEIHEQDDLERSSVTMLFEVGHQKSDVAFRVHLLEPTDEEIVGISIEPIVGDAADVANGAS